MTRSAASIFWSTTPELALKDLVVELALEDWDRVIRTNLYGPFLTTQQAARRMIEQGRGGRIINITSVHEEACGSAGSAYNASKAGLRNLTRTAAVELGEYGITVNVIAPGHDPDPDELASDGRPGIPGDAANGKSSRNGPVFLRTSPTWRSTSRRTRLRIQQAAPIMSTAAGCSRTRRCRTLRYQRPCRKPSPVPSK